MCQLSYFFAFLFQLYCHHAQQIKTYYKYSCYSNNNQSQQSTSQKRHKNKQKIKPREVTNWDDNDEMSDEDFYGYFVDIDE